MMMMFVIKTGDDDGLQNYSMIIIILMMMFVIETCHADDLKNYSMDKFTQPLFPESWPHVHS